MKKKIPDAPPVMAWLVKWAAEVISKYSCCSDGGSPCERLHGEKCTTPLVPSGESVFYWPFKSVRRDKGDVAKKIGIWLGSRERIEETIVGALEGVLKCRVVNRLPNGEQWKKEMVLNMKGAPWELILGKRGQHTPVEIQGDGQSPTSKKKMSQ